MGSIGKNCLLTMVILSLTASAVAQEALWKELSSKVVVLYQQGKFPEASKLAEEALRVAEKTFGSNHPNVALSLSNLAGLYTAQGKYAEAEPFYKRSLAIREMEIFDF